MEVAGPLGWSTLDRVTRLVGGAIAALGASAALSLAFAPPAEAEFKFVGEWGSPTGGELISPIDVERDNAGNTYVVDALARTVHKYDAANNHVLSWGSFGTGPGQFGNPIAIGVNEATGEVYVADFNELNPLGPSGSSASTQTAISSASWAASARPRASSTIVDGIAVNQANGDVFVTEQNRVQRFNAAGQFELMWGKDVDPGRRHRAGDLRRRLQGGRERDRRGRALVSQRDRRVGQPRVRQRGGQLANLALQRHHRRLSGDGRARRPTRRRAGRRDLRRGLSGRATRHRAGRARRASRASTSTTPSASSTSSTPTTSGSSAGTRPSPTRASSAPRAPATASSKPPTD